jgi:16S rRNA (uracil1498-N3)-methyltransferase
MSQPKRLLCPKLPASGRPVKLEENEANHALKVMRLREGAAIEAMDGSGRSVHAVLKLFHGVPHLEFVREVESKASEVVPVVLELAVLKGDAMEWAIEKAVELGIESLVPVMTERTIVRMDKKGPEAFQERWQKIADQALKQCGRLQRMIVEAPRSLEELATGSGDSAKRFWFDEEGSESAPLWKALSEVQAARLRLLVGPEGGWGENERVLLSRGSYERLSLGPLILRAETAALTACALTSAWARARA